MGSLDLSPSQGNNNTPIAPQAAPTQTTSTTSNTIENALRSIRSELDQYSGDSRYIESAKQRLSRIDGSILEQIDMGSIRQSIDGINDTIASGSGIDDSEARLIHQHVSEIMEVYELALKDIQRVENTSQQARDGFIPNDFLTQSDSIFFRDIRDKLSDAESWELQDILDAASDIQIESDDITTTDWDEFFKDLSDEIPSGERTEFRRFVENFKNSPYFYDDRITNLRTGDGIEAMSGSLDEQLATIQSLPDTLPENTKITVEIGGLELDFEGPNARHAAALYIYKVKLVFAELANNQKSLLGNIFSLWLTGNQAVINGVDSFDDSLPDLGFMGIPGFLLTLAGLYVFNIHALAPMESAFRGSKDFLTVRFGNNNVSRLFTWVGKLGEGIENGPKKIISYIPLGNTIRGLIGAPFTITGRTLGIVGTLGAGLFDGVEEAYLDQTIRGINYTVIDGLVSSEAGELDKNEEALKRVRVLEHYKNKWYFDAERVTKFEELEGRNGIIASRTETFWMRVWEIDKGQYINIERGVPIRDTVRDQGYNLMRQTGRTFTIPQFREVVLEDYNKSINRSIDLLKVLFNRVDVPADGGRVDVSEDHSQLFKRLEDYLDLSSGIDGDDEKIREGHLKTLIEYVHQGKIHGTGDELKKQIVLIIKGYEPKFISLERIAHEIETAGDNAHKNRLQRFMTMLNDGKWFGTTAEIDQVITQIQNNTFDFREVPDPISLDQVSSIAKDGNNLSQHRFEMNFGGESDFIDHFRQETTLAGMIGNIDVGEEESRENEIKALYDDMKTKNIGGEQVKVDYTKGQVNFLIEKIMSGNTYTQAKRLLLTLTGDIETNYRQETIRNNLRTSLVSEMRTELGIIETEDDITRKAQLFKQFEDRFLNKIEGDTDLKNFLSRSRPYQEVERRVTRVKTSLSIGLDDYTKVENNRITRGNEIIDLAEGMDGTKRPVITALRNRIIQESSSIPKTSLENILRAILAGDISQGDISGLDFGSYDDESILSERAQEIRIIEGRPVSIRPENGRINENINIQYTDDSRFPAVVRAWNSFIDGRDNILAIRTNIAQSEDILAELRTIDDRIVRLNRELTQASSPVITGQNNRAISTIEREIQTAEAEKAIKNRDLSSLRDARSGIGAASRFTTMTSADIDQYLSQTEEDFRRVLDLNPGFQDFIERNGIDMDSNSVNDLWGQFMSHAQENVVRSHTVERTPGETVTNTVRAAPIPDLEANEMISSERIQASFERIILHDTLTNGDRSIITNDIMYFNLYSAMGAHFSRVEGSTEANIDERMLAMIKEFAEKSGYSSDFPSSVDDVMDIERITQIMDSTIAANTDLRSSFSGIERTPSGIFKAIFDNRSAFLRSIT